MEGRSEPKAFGSSHHFPCNHHPPLCHPSEAEGSAVPRTFLEMFFRQRAPCGSPSSPGDFAAIKSLPGLSQ
jgi:hypothetical protein